MEHTLWDHLFVFVVFVAHSFYAWITYPSFIERVKKRGEPARIAGYLETVVIWLAFSAALVALWFVEGRAWADLGILWGDPLRFAAGLALSVAILWLTYKQIKELAMRGSSAVADQLGGVCYLIPHTRRELGWFCGVSVNAGVTEELIFRGFLLWYLEPYVGMGWAAVLAIVAFTVAHAYQGIGNVPGLLFASACFVGLYLLTGSLLLPIILHALIDTMQGVLLSRSGKPTPTSGELAMQAGE